MHSGTTLKNPETRAFQRTNMFVGALLRGRDFCAPVTIRNMSPTGAQLSAAAVPEPAYPVQLIRGSLTVPASVIWAAEQRCGIQFSSVVSVREWLAPLDNREQTRVDETVALIKSGAVPLSVSHRGHSNYGAGSPAAVHEDLARASRLIEAVADQLAGDPAVVSNYPETLQSLEIAVQSLSAIADSLVGSSTTAGPDPRMEALRLSCDQALRRALTN